MVGLEAGNQRLKRLRRLLSQRRARATEQVFVIEGPQVVAEALADPAVVVEGLYLDGDADRDLEVLARGRGIPVHRAAAGVLARVLDTVSPRPVAAVCARRGWVLADLATPGPVVLVVEGRDPGNLGTVIRSAEASGAVGVILGGDTVDHTNPKCLRASAGAALRLPIVVAPDLDALLDDPVVRSRSVVALVADERGAVPYDEVDLTNAVLTVGNEAHGLPAPVIARADVAVTIPLAGPTESLNLAVAASVACFEALRQRRAAAKSSGPNTMNTSGLTP